MNKRIKNKKSKLIPIHYSLKEIKLVTNKLYENLVDVSNAENLKYKLRFSITIDKLHSLFIIEVQYGFLYDLVDLFELHISSTYKIDKINLVVENRTINDEMFLLHLMQLSLAHARGVQSTLIESNQLYSYLVPTLSEDFLSANMKELVVIESD